MSKTNIEYHEGLMEESSPAYLNWFDKEKEILRNEIKKGSKVLCLACGDGREIEYITDIADEIIGIDHDEKAVEHAREHLKKYKNVKVEVGEASKLSFEDESFDYVLCMTSFTNLADEKIPVLKEMKRLVKQEGLLFLSAYSENAMEERMKMYKKLDAEIVEKREDGTVIFDESLGDNISEQFTEDQLRGFFKEVNLNIEKIENVDIGYICVLSK